MLSPSYFILSGITSNCPLLFPSSILDTFGPGELIFWSHICLLFHTAHGVLQARILEWVAISFSSGPHFVRSLHHDLSILGVPTWHGSKFHELEKAVVHVIKLVSLLYFSLSAL